MKRPSHRLISTGAAVYPEGHDPADLEPLSADDWTAHRTTGDWAILRQQRDRLLAIAEQARFTVDAPEETREAWRLYRQALRDLPAKGKNPARLTWPKRPDEE